MENFGKILLLGMLLVASPVKADVTYDEIKNQIKSNPAFKNIKNMRMSVMNLLYSERNFNTV